MKSLPIGGPFNAVQPFATNFCTILKIQPQSGTNITSANERGEVAVYVDTAAIVDTSGIVTRVAGRPQPPIPCFAVLFPGYPG